MATGTLFLCYLHVARAPVNSDGASNALQAWDMLHGNLLLHGWQLSDVSFYTTELPQYMLVEQLRGLGPDMVHVAAAMTYTLLILLAALLAKGTAGREAIADAARGRASCPRPSSASASRCSSCRPTTSAPRCRCWLPSCCLTGPRRRW